VAALIDHAVLGDVHDLDELCAGDFERAAGSVIFRVASDPQRIEAVAAGQYKVVTPQGEIFFRIEGDAQTGVIDMYGGPNETALAHWPTRVISLGNDQSMFIFTALQYPGISDSDFATQCRGLEQEFPHIKAYVEAPAS